MILGVVRPKENKQRKKHPVAVVYKSKTRKRFINCMRFDELYDIWKAATFFGCDRLKLSL